MHHAVLVTSGTGHQGGAVARHLLSNGHSVRVLARSPSSNAAQALRLAGATIIPGSYDDLPALRQASTGATALFLNPYPSPSDPSLEVRHARNIIEATRAAGVRVVVYSSMMLVDRFAGKVEGMLASKWEIEGIVRKAGFEQWTVLRPAWLMQNFLAPVRGVFWPELVAEKGVVGGRVMNTACKVETKLLLIDAEDVGKFAAAAIENPTHFHGQEINLGGELLTVKEIARQLASVVGEVVRVNYLSDKEVVGKSPLFAHEKACEMLAADIGVTSDEWGVRMNSFDGFTTGNLGVLRDELKAQVP